MTAASTTNANDCRPRFSAGFLTRLFLVVMEEEAERRKKLELEEDEKGRSATRARLWNAIRNNLNREVGKRQKSICLSAAQVEALGTNARLSQNKNVEEGVYFFSCGHHYKSAELRQYFSSPTSSSFVSSSAFSALWPNDQNDAVFQLYDQMKDFQAKSLACPACLTQALKTMVID